MSKALYAVAFQGDVITFGALEELRNYDRQYRSEHPLLTPIAETPLDRDVSTIFSLPKGDPLSHLRHHLEGYYRDDAIYGAHRYGPFGDIIQVTLLEEYATDGSIPAILNWIAPKAFRAPRLAADLVVFVRARDTDYFVGITRKNKPGKGKPALIGGFMEVDGFHFDSPLETVHKEAAQEARIAITFPVDAMSHSDEPLSPEVYDVTVSLPRVQKFFSAKLTNIGVVNTSEQENLLSGYKRVNWACGCLLGIDMSDLEFGSEAALAAMFEAGSDAGSMYVQKIKPGLWAENFPPFAIRHHKITFGQALQKFLQLSFREDS